MKIFKIISYGFCLFLVCLSVSVLIKAKFNIEGDYLSTFATLIATFAAFHLYTDWKLAHSLNLLAESQTSMKDIFSRIFLNYKSVRRLLLSIEGSTGREGENLWIEASKELNKLFNEISRAKFVVIEYQSCLKSLKEIEILNAHLVKVGEIKELVDLISNQFMDGMPIYTGGPNQTTKCLELLSSWESSFLKFDVYCSLVLPDFYFKYFKALK